MSSIFDFSKLILFELFSSKINEKLFQETVPSVRLSSSILLLKLLDFDASFCEEINGDSFNFIFFIISRPKLSSEEAEIEGLLAFLLRECFGTTTDLLEEFPIPFKRPGIRLRFISFPRVVWKHEWFLARPLPK